MKINFTKKEYKVLLEMIALADWVLHATKVKEDPKTAGHRELEEKIYSYAKEMGYKHLIEYSKRLERHFPSRQFEENGPVRTFIEEYENDIFWEELIARLADRDLLREFGDDKPSAISGNEMMVRTMRFEEKYSDEFVANGLDNVVIKRKSPYM